MTRLLPDDLLVTRALVELDNLIPAGFGKMPLKVVGGYALLVRGVRTDAYEATDIDYIGRPLPTEIRRIVDDVGLKYGLGPDWLNNDVMLSGATDIDEIELSTGPLHFDEYDTGGLRHFTVEVADDASLLRMKLVAIDTQMASFVDSRDHGDFTRGKDFADIARICQRAPLSRGALESMIEEMAEGGYLIEPGATLTAARLAAEGRSEVEILGDVARSASDDDLYEDFDFDDDEDHDGGFDVVYEYADSADSPDDAGDIWDRPHAPPPTHVTVSAVSRIVASHSEWCGALTSKGTRCKRRGTCPFHH